MAGVEEMPPDLDWVQLRKDMKALDSSETSGQKSLRKFKENPLVPIGAGATALALSVGLWSFRQGKMKMSQNMMRARILAQGFTIAALVWGVMATTKSSTTKE